MDSANLIIQANPLVVQSADSPDDLALMAARPERLWSLDLELDRVKVKAILDTGSTISLVAQSVWSKMESPLLSGPVGSIKTAGPGMLSVQGDSIMDLSLNGVSIQWRFRIVRDLSVPILLGLDFMERTGVIFRFDQETLSLCWPPAAKRVELKMSRQDKSEEGPFITIAAPDEEEEEEKEAFLTESLPSAPEVQSEEEFHLLPPEIQEKHQLLMEKYHGLFTEVVDSVAKLKYQHRIDVGDALPVKQPPRRVNPIVRQALQEHVESMVRLNIAERSESPWSSPVLMVRKADSTWRFCVDLRRVNDLTRKDSYPLPVPADYLSVLQGASIFSVLDLRSGFWQIPLHPDSRPITAFSTPDGLWQFRVLPFGLSNSPAAFQRAMDEILGPLKWRGVLVYIDDILVYSSDLPTHLALLEEVMSRLHRHDFKLKMTKCFFYKKSIKYLGHIVSAQGISASPDLTRAMVEYPPPSRLKELRAFLGLTSYYRKFVPHYAQVTAPLRALLKKETAFKWSPICQSAFEALKAKLLQPPILRHPDYSRPFIIQTDASDEGISGVLSQRGDDGQEYAVAYVSRGLSEAELKWSTMEKEALAVVYSIQQYETFLSDRDFIVETDNQSLQWLKTGEKKGKLSRWATVLQAANLKVVHRKGKSNANADALSRVPREHQPAPGPNESPFPEKADCFVIGIGERVDPVDLESDANFTNIGAAQLRDAQKGDAALKEVYDFLHEGKLPVDVEEKQMQLRTKTLSIERGLLVCNENPSGKTKVLVPEALQRRLIVAYHDVLLAHAGVDKTLSALSSLFQWKGMSESVRKYVQSCDGCQHSSKRTLPLRAGLLQPRYIQYPFEVIHVDFFGPIRKSADGNRFILTVVDSFTRWPILVALPDSTSATVNAALWSHVYSVHGCPGRIVSDQGPQFTSHLYEEFQKILGINIVMSSPYHPQGNGPAERIHRFLKASLQILVSRNQEDWDLHLTSVEFAYRITKLAGYAYSPFQILYGREPRTPMDALLGNPSIRLGIDDYIAHLTKTLSETHKDLRETQANLRLSQKASYDKNHYAVEFQPGDLVLVYIQEQVPGLSTKLIKPWKGPYRVLQQKGPVNYELDCMDGSTKVYHVQRMSLYYSPSKPEEVVPASEVDDSKLWVPSGLYDVGDLIIYLERDKWILAQVLEKFVKERRVFVWQYGTEDKKALNIWKNAYFPSYQDTQGNEKFTTTQLPEPWSRVTTTIGTDQVILTRPRLVRGRFDNDTVQLIQAQWMAATAPPVPPKASEHAA